LILCCYGLCEVSIVEDLVFLFSVMFFGPLSDGPGFLPRHLPV
jgi:hypothetical protein